MRINSSGNVGIGTSSPGVNLDIKGETGSEASLRLYSFNSVASTYQNARLQFELQATASSTRDLDWVAKQEASGTGGAMCYEYEGTERLRITSAGRVGIGTSSPTTTLAVAGTLSATGTVTAATYAGAGTSLTGTANSLNAGIGVNQTWTSVARAIGTTYTNSTGKPISVAITATCSSATTVQGLTINGTVVYAGSVGDAGTACGISLIVPNGATYVTATNAGTLTLVSWYELR
jgi:hypothetical protein